MGNAGRSEIHSALVAEHSAQVWVIRKLLAGSMASVSVSRYVEPLRATLAATTSPGRRDVPTSTEPAGYISHQVKYVALPWKHQLIVPSCSTVSLLKPSRPTHCALIWSSRLHSTAGVRHRPPTSLKVPAVFEASA